MKETHKHWIAQAVLIAILTLCFWPVIRGRATLVPTDMLHQLTIPFSTGAANVHVQNHYTFDVLTQFYPAYDFFSRCVQNGEWPVWNPYIFGGHPIFASSMYSFANPFNAVFWFMPMPAAFHWRTVLQFFAAALFMYWMLRDWKLAPSACLLGSLAYGLNSQFLFNYWYGGFQTFVWMPLAVLFFDRSMIQGQWLRNCLLAGVFAGLGMLAGNLQSAAYVLVFLSIYAAATAFLGCREVSLARFVWVLGIIAVVSLLTASLQFIPSLELLACEAGQRIHQALGSTSFLKGLLALPCLITFVFPGLWGSTETFDLMKAVSLSAGDVQGYIGVVPFLLLALVVVAWRQSRVRVLSVCAVGVIGLLLLFPLVRQLFYFRFLVAYVFVAAALAALGLNALLREPVELWKQPRCRWLLRFAAFFLGAIGAGIVMIQVLMKLAGPSILKLSHQFLAQRSHETIFGSESRWLAMRVAMFWEYFRLANPEFLIPFITGGLSIWLVRRQIQGRKLSWLAIVLVLFTALELVPMAQRTIPMIDQKTFPLYPMTDQLAELQRTATRVARVPTPGRKILPDNLLMVYRIASPSGYESLRPLTPSELYRESTWGFDPSDLRMAGVSHVVMRTNETNCLPFLNLLNEGGIRVLRNEEMQARVRFVTQYHPAVGLEEARRLLEQRPRKSECVIETEQPPSVASSRSVARITFESPTKVEILIATDAVGFMVLADTYYPGWQATVDGRTVRIYRANAVHRAVFLEPGTHRVCFQYKPVSIRLGAAISGTTILICLAFWLSGRRRDSRAPK